MDWQPIETAPKDGSPILVFCETLRRDRDAVYVCRWTTPLKIDIYSGGPGYWVEAGGEQYAEYKPTHWMPLPEPPSTAA